MSRGRTTKRDCEAHRNISTSASHPSRSAVPRSKTTPGGSCARNHRCRTRLRPFIASACVDRAGANRRDGDPAPTETLGTISNPCRSLVFPHLLLSPIGDTVLTTTYCGRYTRQSQSLGSSQPCCNHGGIGLTSRRQTRMPGALQDSPGGHLMPLRREAYSSLKTLVEWSNKPFPIVSAFISLRRQPAGQACRQATV